MSDEVRSAPLYLVKGTLEKTSPREFLEGIGARLLAGLYVLDGFSPDYYLIFANNENEEDPELAKTMGIFIAKTGTDYLNPNHRILIKSAIEPYYAAYFLQSFVTAMLLSLDTIKYLHKVMDSLRIGGQDDE